MEGNIEGGEFVIGGSNPAHYEGDFIDVDISDVDEYWSFSFSS